MHNDFPSLALHCLGPPSVRVDGREAPPDVLWRKHVALLTYLALSPDGTRSRSHLLGLLWPESPDDKARRSLNEAIRRLRSALGTERLLTRGDALQLNASELEVDIQHFETLRAEGQLRALELLRGEFLEGFHVDDAPVFEDWMGAQRAQIREAATGLLVARAEEQLAVNRYGEARALARLDRYPREGPACLVIVGDPGSGRTRLLAACTERLALAGATVATARLLESDHDAPWSTLRTLMRGGLQLAPGLTGTDHVGLR